MGYAGLCAADTENRQIYAQVRGRGSGQTKAETLRKHFTARQLAEGSAAAAYGGDSSGRSGRRPSLRSPLATAGGEEAAAPGEFVCPCGAQHGDAELPAAMAWLWGGYDPAKTADPFPMEPEEKAKPYFRVAIVNR
jgi:hypothetical protein